jgi:multiple sugar transport system substrate-binding protein
VKALPILTAVLAVCCACGPTDPSDALTFSGSAVGREGESLRRQLARFTERTGMRVALRTTPDAAEQRHQLYVQWLNAHAEVPDVLQLDVIWTPEFAAAGWILPLDRFGPPVDAFFPATVAANRWRSSLYALPWFVDVGLLYWRTDLLARAPETFEELTTLAQKLKGDGRTRFGLVWQGARYEGLVTTFLEYLAGFGGTILDERGRVVVDEEPAIRALTYMRNAIWRDGVVPAAVLTWHEEETRFAFQNGDAALMRNWPYAFTLVANGSDSRVAGRVGIAPMPATDGGTPAAALGGGQLAINARSRMPDAAYALIEYLTAPDQLLDRARDVGQLPPRPALYALPELASALVLPASDVRRIIDAAVPRPATPVYTQLSELLQIRLHRALTRQQEPGDALAEAAREMRRLLERTGLTPPEPIGNGR